MARTHRRATGALWAAGVAVTLAVNACTGIIGSGQGDDDCIACDDPQVQAAASLQTSRFPRLSHLQWENTVRDLLRLSGASGLSTSFTGDPLGGMFDNNEAVLLVSPAHWSDYQVAAEELSAAVTSDPNQLALIVPVDLPSDATEAARAFIVDFGKRAYRRPLSEDEVLSYLSLFQQAPSLFDGSADDFTKGVRLALQAFLQSPHFLYRVEGSSEISSTDGLIHLTGWEIASKLSYMLWNTMPDDALFAAAESGKLDTAEGILAQTERMLDDERARPMVATFHAQLYQYDHYDDLYKDPAIFPSFSSELGEDMKKEVEMFIDEVVFDGGGLRELLTSPFTYVNDELAQLYGLEGTFGPEFQRVELDPVQRAGFLTRIGFLASNATPKEPNTIHRGVFINLRVLCNTLPSPPDNVAGLPPADDYPTNRQRVESHTGEGTCGASCHHTLINPPGYALENYDAVGAFRSEEKGMTIDAQADYSLDGQPVSFNGGVEMSELFASAEQVHRCYAKHWLEFGYGRQAQEGDSLTIDELGAQSQTGSVRDLILALTQTTAFRTRAPLKEETP